MKVEKKNKSNKKDLNKKSDDKSIKLEKNNKKQNKVVKNLKNVNQKDLKTQATEKPTKQKKKTETPEQEDEEPSKDNGTLDKAQAAKAEKKKAKKVAQKLKKEERNKEKQNNLNKNQKQSSPKKDQKKKSSDKNDHPSRDPEVEAATVFVGNLPVTTKRVQIVKLFAKIGNVKSIRLRTAAGQVIFKHKQRKQAGTLNAYVVLNNAEAAQKALELNGQEFKGNHLRVTPSDPEKNRKEHDTKRTVFVGNLKWSANEEKLREIFSNCGEIDYIRCIYDGQSKCKGVAYVCFKAPEAVGLALELNETLLDDRPIHVERYMTKKLGAKAARDKEANANANKKTDPKKSGAIKRINAKNNQKGENGTSNEVKKDKKKSEFRGVKVTAMKKKNKKKMTNEMKSIAKKIAPIDAK